MGPHLLAQSENVMESVPDKLLIKKLGKEFLITTNDVEWIEASGNYANLHIANKIFPMRITMKRLAEQLPGDFVRIHRSTIVNANHVMDIEPIDGGDYEVRLKTGQQLVLSRRYRDAFRQKFSF